MTKTVLGGLILATIGAVAVVARGADGPPVAPVRPVTDVYHGVKVVDPYRYMERLDDPEVQAWIKGQAEYAQQYLRAIPGRDRLYQRIRELDAGAPYQLHVVRRWANGDLHYLKRLAGENLDKLYVRDGKTGAERLLVDPERFASGSKHAALNFTSASDDGRYVAYGIAAAGSEQTTLHVIEVASGNDLPDTIDRMEAEYTPPYWLPDGSGFVYSRRPQLPADAPATEVYKRSRALLHKLGTDPDKDPTIFSMDSSSDVPMADTDFPSVVIFRGSRYVIGKIKHGDQNELTVYAAPLASLTKGPIEWRRVCDVTDEVSDFAVRGDDIYLLTASKAPRYRVVRVSLGAPDFAAAPTVVPATSAVIQSLGVARDALYVELLDGGVNRLGRLAFDADAKVERINAPDGATSVFPSLIDTDIDGILAGTASWTRGGKLYAFDPKTRAFTDTGLHPRGKFDDVEGYESHEVMVTSHDGVKVPLSIIHKKGLTLDGSHPTLVSGYGAYGMIGSVHFNPIDLAWLERGGVIAHAHVRGGGEFGKEWHLAGQKATKHNTWKDFIACCEYLVKQRYTSPAKLAGAGGSAGGILIGRAVTERPDLFAAAAFHVGCLDMLRMETTTNGVPNIPEFGSVATKEGFDALLAMSAYNHVVEGTKYPAVLLLHGINDPRVEPWMSAKMTARLQAATSSGRPVLFRVDYDAGHGIGSTREQRQRQTADEWAFMLSAMREREFSK